MDWREIAESTHEHQLALFKIQEGVWTVTAHSDLSLYQHISMDYSRGMKTMQPVIKRNPHCSLEFTHHRGHQHKHLHHAVSSFLASAKDAYLAHLSASDNFYNQVDKNLLIQLFKKPSYKIKNGVYTSTDDACFFFVYNNVVHHVRLHITVKRGIANNYSGNLQVVAHHFDNSGGSDENVDVIYERLMSMVPHFEQQIYNAMQNE